MGLGRAGGGKGGHGEGGVGAGGGGGATQGGGLAHLQNAIQGMERQSGKWRQRVLLVVFVVDVMEQPAAKLPLRSLFCNPCHLFSPCVAVCVCNRNYAHQVMYTAYGF